MSNLKSEIAKRKCSLFGQLYRLDPPYTVKRLFLQRLSLISLSMTYGFVVDTLKLISDFGLECYVLTFLNTVDFLGKYVPLLIIINSILMIKCLKLFIIYMQMSSPM